jgi:hypothetical protein
MRERDMERKLVAYASTRHACIAGLSLLGKVLSEHG